MTEKNNRETAQQLADMSDKQLDAIWARGMEARNIVLSRAAEKDAKRAEAMVGRCFRRSQQGFDDGHLRTYREYAHIVGTDGGLLIMRIFYRLPDGAYSVYDRKEAPGRLRGDDWRKITPEAYRAAWEKAYAKINAYALEGFE